VSNPGSVKCQSVKELEVVVTLSNAQGSKSQQEPSEIIASNNLGIEQSG
jgi:hypothetical protein